MTLKLVFNSKSGKILGAQIVGCNGIDNRINVLAVAIQAKMTVFDLEEMELAYCPAYGAGKDIINMAGFVAANQIKGMADFLPFLKAHEMIEKGEIELKTSHTEFDPNSTKKQVILIDVRPAVLTKFTEKPFVHLPLCRFRKEYAAIVGDKSLYGKGSNNEIWITCLVGRTAYFAYRDLLLNGFENLKTIQGGYDSLGKLVL